MAMLGVLEGPAPPALKPAIGTVKHKYPPKNLVRAATMSRDKAIDARHGKS